MLRNKLCTAFLVLAALAGAGAPVFADPPPRFSVSDAFLPGSFYLADTGRHFCAMTQTPGTAYNLSGATQNAFSATAAMWTITNTTTAAVGTRIYPERAFVLITTAGTGATRAEVAIAIDSTSRYASGGTSQVVKNVNMDSTTVSSIATVFGGDIVAAAASGSVRYTARATVSSAATAIGQMYSIVFGGGNSVTPEGGRMLVLPPIVIGPGGTGLVHLWFPGLSAQPTGELMVCWNEK